MNVSLAFILILGVVSSTLAADCRYSYCAGNLISGQTTCNDALSGSTYSGKYKKSDCGWDSSRVECCRPTKGGECKKSKCVGVNYGPVTACKITFGADWLPSGKKEGCTGVISGKRFECCQ